MDQSKSNFFTSAQAFVGILALIGLAVSAGFYLNETFLGEIASKNSGRQLAASSWSDDFHEVFKCVNPNAFTITAANTISNPVLVPFVNNGECDSSLPTVINVGSSNSANFIIDESSDHFTGSDGNQYGTEAIRHGEYLSPTAEYPQGYFKFYFVDPGKLRKTTASTQAKSVSSSQTSVSSSSGRKVYHSADTNKDYLISRTELDAFSLLYQQKKITLTQLTRASQFLNAGGYHQQTGTEDGFAPGLITSSAVSTQVSQDTSSVSAISRSEKASGSMTLYIGYRKSPYIKTVSIDGQGSFVYDVDDAGQAIKNVAPAGAFFVSPDQSPLVKIDYLVNYLPAGSYVRERIWSSETVTRVGAEVSPVFDRTITISDPSSLRTLSWSPTTTASDIFYFASICPVKSNKQIDGTCIVKSFIVAEASPFAQFVATGTKPGEKSILDPLGKCVTEHTMPATGADLVLENPDRTICNVGRQSIYNPIYQDVICYQSGGPWDDYPGAGYPGDLSILANLSGAIGSHINYSASGDGSGKQVPTAYHLQRDKDKAVGEELSFKAIFPVRGGAAMSAVASGIFKVIDPTSGKETLMATSGQMKIVVTGVGKKRQHCQKDEYIAMDQEGEVVLYAVDTSGNGGLKKIANFATGVADRPIGTTVNIGKKAIGGIVGFVKSKKAGQPKDGKYPFVNAGQTSCIVSLSSNPWPDN